MQHSQIINKIVIFYDLIIFVIVSVLKYNCIPLIVILSFFAELVAIHSGIKFSLKDICCMNLCKTRHLGKQHNNAQIFWNSLGVMFTIQSSAVYEERSVDLGTELARILLINIRIKCTLIVHVEGILVTKS